MITYRFFRVPRGLLQFIRMKIDFYKKSPTFLINSWYFFWVWNVQNEFTPHKPYITTLFNKYNVKLVTNNFEWHSFTGIYCGSMFLIHFVLGVQLPWVSSFWVYCWLVCCDTLVTTGINVFVITPHPPLFYPYFSLLVTNQFFF